MQNQIDTIVASTSDHPAHTGLVVGVLQDGQRSVHGYGAADRDPPTGDTVFEIGSVTKVFTTALLSILVGEGALALDDPAAQLSILVGEGAAALDDPAAGRISELADFPAQVTLHRLATHTAGLPKMPSNIIGSMLRDRGNPYAAYTLDAMLRYLSKNPPAQNRIRAGLVDYSNLGMGLLGMLLARKLEDSFEGAIRGRICESLRMPDTGIQLSADQERRLAAPHGSGGKAGHNWDLPAFAGAGALRSTANDLLTFLAAHLGDAPPAMKAPLQYCHAVRARTFAAPGLLQRLVARLSGQDLHHDRTREGMALGWTVGRLPAGATQVHWHHGATGGYRAFVGFIKDRRAAAVVLTNSGLSMRDALLGVTATDRVGFGILEHLVAPI